MDDQATAYLQPLINQADGNVLIMETDRDRDGRTVGEVFTVTPERENFQEERLLARLAYVYPQYVGSYPNAAPMEIAEAIAQEQRADVWASSKEMGFSMFDCVWRWSVTCGSGNRLNTKWHLFAKPLQLLFQNHNHRRIQARFSVDR
jgi:hypothetical protein